LCAERARPETIIGRADVVAGATLRGLVVVQAYFVDRY
jgi:hypothetical protein